MIFGQFVYSRRRLTTEEDSSALFEPTISPLGDRGGLKIRAELKINNTAADKFFDLINPYLITYMHPYSKPPTSQSDPTPTTMHTYYFLSVAEARKSSK